MWLHTINSLLQNWYSNYTILSTDKRLIIETYKNRSIRKKQTSKEVFFLSKERKFIRKEPVKYLKKKKKKKKNQKKHVLNYQKLENRKNRVEKSYKVLTKFKEI